MAKSTGGSSNDGPDKPEELPEHPLVERLKPDPSQPAKRVTVLTGLPGKSDRAGYQRLYLTTKLDYYAEFPTSDMVHAEVVPADQSPFPGIEASRVSISRDATIHYIWAKSPQPVDEFDLDIRLGVPVGASTGSAIPAKSIIGNTVCTCDGTCDSCHKTCGTCGNTCTCQTQCNQPTCGGTCTCQTQCNQPTCAGTCTCQTQCNQPTCGGTCSCHKTCAPDCTFTCCGRPNTCI